MNNQIGYNSFVAEDGNQVWAGALTLAWKEFTQFAKLDFLAIESSSLGCQQIAQNYNKSLFSKDALDEKSYYVKSGKGQQTVNLINKQRDSKFPQCTLPQVKAQIGDNGVISYAYLYKKVMYPVKFERRQNCFTFKGKNGQVKIVPSFYTDDKNQEEQVFVVKYEDNDNFILKIPGVETSKDEIYLYKQNKGKTVGQVIKLIVEASQKTGLYSIEESNLFEVPIIDLDYTRQVTEMMGAKITNFEGRVIESMVEAVKLKLDESGARVENDGVMYTNECAIVNSQTYKFNSPFWIVMKEQGKHPYLCVKINNI